MSSSSNTGGSKTEKDKQKMIQDKCQLILTQMLRDEDNKYCVDCDAKGPRWASWNLGIFLCIRCAGIHRNLGVHISKVKSVNLDSWTPEQVVSLQQMGNSRARAVYEANLPDNFKRPQTDSQLETFIRGKYESKKYIAREWVQPPPVKVSWDAEIEMELKRKKDAKRKGTAGSPGSVELPTPTSTGSVSRTNSSNASAKPAKESPTPVAPIPAPTSASKPSQDLLGLDIVNAPSSEDLFGGLLVGAQSTSSTPSATNGSTSAPASGKDSEEDSFFNQKAPSTNEKRTLDKNSILALYNQGSSTQPTIQQSQQLATPAQQQMNVSMFATPHSGVSIYATPQTHPHTGHPGIPSAMGAFGQSPALQQLGPNGVAGTQFNPMLQGNHLFSSPMFPSGASSGLNQQHTPLNPVHNINQLSQQMMAGLQLAGPSPSATASPMIQSINPMMHSGLNGGMTGMTNPQMSAFGAMGGAPTMNHHAMASAIPSYPNVFLGSNVPAAAASSAAGHTLSTNLWQ